MSDERTGPNFTRRELIGTVGRAVVLTAALPHAIFDPHDLAAAEMQQPLNALAGVDRVVMAQGRTYLNGWAGYGEPPRRGRTRGGAAAPQPAEQVPTTPPAVQWTKKSGPGEVAFADQSAAVTTATFSAPGEYELELAANDAAARVISTVHVKVELPPPARPLNAVYTKPFSIDSRLWNDRAKMLMVNWIPHCIDQINRDDLTQGPGGIDNFIEAAKALRGEPHGVHKGYVFSNAWVHQTVEAMSIALMIDPRGDQEIMRAQAKMRATLDDWIPKILAAREPDGYLHTAFTLRDRNRWPQRWSAQGRPNHEGYVAGYFLESAINHYLMTDRRDSRLYDAAKQLADCWDEHIGPAPKQEWYDGHQEMEQALVRFGRFVNDMEGGGKGDRYIALAKFLLDCRKNGTEYDQSHLPVVQQYEAVGHAVRAVYSYSAMADVAVETRDVDYQSAVKSLWESIVNRKYYLTGGIGSGETSEGFGPEYSLRSNSYCETCASCGEVFFQWKLHLAYHDASYIDLLEETFYNGLLGSVDLEARNFYYTNPLDANAARTRWHNCPCCVGNLARTLLMMPTWMYTTGPDSLFVNLFIGSTATLEDVAGTAVKIVQETNYPWDGRVAITVDPAKPTRFSVRVRAPNRSVSKLYTSSPAADGIASLAVNGARVSPQLENGYAVITRTWRPGDRIEVMLPLRVQRVHASDRIAATRGRVALRYGPLVYNIEQVDQDITGVLHPGAPLTTEWREDLLGGVLVIHGRFADGGRLMAIPNYTRYNRDPEGSLLAVPQEPGQRPAPPPPTSIVWIAEQRLLG